MTRRGVQETFTWEMVCLLFKREIPFSFEMPIRVAEEALMHFIEMGRVS